jgi:putative adhesin
MTFRNLAVAFATLAAAGCSRTTVNDDAFSWSDTIPDGATVHVLDGTGSITVRAAGNHTALVRGAVRSRRGRLKDITFAVNRDGGDYYICAMWRTSGRCGASGYRGSSSHSWWTIFSLFHHGSDAVANFTVNLPAATRLDARTTTGIVTIDGATAGVTAHAVNGGVHVSDVSGPLALTTVNGDVRLSAATLAPTDSVHLSSVNGAVRAELPPSLDGQFDISVTNGVVRSDLMIPGVSTSRRRISGQVGSSDRVVRVHTVNGAVILTSHQGLMPATVPLK